MYDYQMKIHLLKLTTDFKRNAYSNTNNNMHCTGAIKPNMARLLTYWGETQFQPDLENCIPQIIQIPHRKKNKHRLALQYLIHITYHLNTCYSNLSRPNKVHWGQMMSHLNRCSSQNWPQREDSKEQLCHHA